jgi:superfamily II DNA or RNA helicase
MISVENLFPHQRSLVEEYRSGGAPRVVALDAPTGTGKSVALAVIAAERAAQGRLVMVVTQPVLAHQWANRVRDAGVIPSAVYASPADFRLAMDTDTVPWPDSGVVIFGYSVARAPIAAKLLLAASPSLLVVDDVAVSANSELGRVLRGLADRAAQVIFTRAQPNAWFPPHETRRWTYPLSDIIGRRLAPRLKVRVHDYEGDQAEAEAVRQAREILQQAEYPLQNALFTRPAFQSALLSLVRRLEASEQLPLLEEDMAEFEVERAWSPSFDRRATDAIWDLLDRFDNLPPDRRLLATIDEMKSAYEQGRAVLIVTSLVREVDYLVAAIESPEIPIVTVTGRTPLDQRLAASEKVRAGSALVVTSLFFTAMQNPLPDGTRSIWFTPPRSQYELRHWLGTGISNNNLEVVLPRAIPPVSPADELVDSLTEVLQDPWLDYED